MEMDHDLGKTNIEARLESERLKTTRDVEIGRSTSDRDISMRRLNTERDIGVARAQSESTRMDRDLTRTEKAADRGHSEKMKDLEMSRDVEVARATKKGGTTIEVGTHPKSTESDVSKGKRMAELEVKRHDRGAWALLLNPDGFITEGTGSNYFLIKKNKSQYLI